jgi:hypothetical protein
MIEWLCLDFKGTTPSACEAWLQNGCCVHRLGVKALFWSTAGPAHGDLLTRPMTGAYETSKQ